jgi:cell division septation protein DedD
MAENRRGKENRLYFTRGQMVLLGGAFTLTSVMIFFIGMFVGKGIEERKRTKQEEPLVKIPVKPSPKETGGAPAAQSKDEISFNDGLSKPAGGSAAAEEKSKEVAPAEKISKTEPKETKLPAKAEAAAPKPVEKKVEKSSPAEEAPKKAEATETAAEKDQSKIWRAQVNAYPDERSAKLIVDRLKNKGYNAYVTEVQNKGKTWFRVSVGKYGSREEADKIADVLKNKENFPKAFVASR